MKKPECGKGPKMPNYLAQYAEVTESLNRRLGDRSKPIERLTAELPGIQFIRILMMAGLMVAVY